MRFVGGVEAREPRSPAVFARGDVQAAIDAARPGSVVVVGDVLCGPLVMRPGVTLIGERAWMEGRRGSW